MNLKKENDQVYYATDEVIIIQKEDIEDLKKKMEEKNLERIRICIHKDVDDILHEMFVILKKGNYVRPHRHVHKSESFYLFEGSATAFFFDDSGNIKEKIQLGEFCSGRQSGYRLNRPVYHTVVPTSEYMVFHEVASGPFDRADTEYAPWAPKENTIEGKNYIKKIMI